MAQKLSHTISKTDFVRFLQCPRYAWLNKNRRDLCHDEQKRLRKQGIEVENKAHGLFEEGQEVPFGGYRLHLNAAALKTKELMADPLVNVIYQVTEKI